MAAIFQLKCGITSGAVVPLHAIENSHLKRSFEELYDNFRQINETS